MPTTASSAYSSWTVPSLDGLFSARRASAFGLRYGLTSVAGTMVGGVGGGGGLGPAVGRVSPAHSGMSMMMEGGSAGASLQIKARKSMFVRLFQLLAFSRVKAHRCCMLLMRPFCCDDSVDSYVGDDYGSFE